MGLAAADIRRAARDALGVDRLLPGQREAIAAVTDGRDTLALLPTGGGKSAIYQVAGLEIAGPTLVVSPLIALMQDQLARLRSLDLPAAALHSGASSSEREAALAGVEAGELEFLLLSPEQLADRDILARLAHGKPSLFVVDEAHCVAEWGSDFRPEYRRLGAVAEALGRPPILGLTATASPLLRAEIIERLGLQDPIIVARGFDRPNLRLLVSQHADAAAKRRAVVEAVRDRTSPGIVYVATRAAAASVARDLSEDGIRAAAYHAGLGTRRRQAIQDAFMADELDVIVATIAFGMGIDKPDVRFVIHHDVSESLDAYHQEIGRAGRDGEPADILLTYRAEDLGLRRFQAAPARIEEADVTAVLRALRRATAPIDVPGLAAAAHRSRRRTDAVVGRLEELHAVRTAPDGTVTVAPDEEPPAAPGALAAAAVAAQDRRRAVERSRVDMIRGYAETPGCRRAVLLGYFGEPFEPPCGHCDRCEAGLVAVPEVHASRAGRFAIDDRVQHAHFGVGIVTAVDGDRLTVAFEAVGYKVLDAEEARERAGLAPIEAA